MTRHKPKPSWRIYKSSPGPYLNSPAVWNPVMVLRAKTAGEAAANAMFIVGSSLIRVEEIK